MSIRLLFAVNRSEGGRGVGWGSSEGSVNEVDVHLANSKRGIVEGPLPHAVDREKGWREGANVCQRLNRKSREADLVSDAHLRVCRHHELDPCTGVAMDPHVVSDLKRSVGEGVGGGADLHFSRGVPHCLAI
jgi:hypothetical protein